MTTSPMHPPQRRAALHPAARSAMALRAVPASWLVLPWFRAAPPAPDVHASEASWGCESALPFLQHLPGALAGTDRSDDTLAAPCCRDVPS